MSLELLSTLGTLATVAIVAATAIAALVQLRHLRAGNQINAMLSIGDNYYGREFMDELNLTRSKLARAMEDPTFRNYVAAIWRGISPPEIASEYVEVRRAAVSICNTHEELGNLVKNGAIEKRIFIEQFCNNITPQWELLQKFIAFSRAVLKNESIWENFEWLTVLGTGRASTQVPIRRACGGLNSTTRGQSRQRQRLRDDRAREFR